MNEVFFIQPNPDLLAMSQAFCSLDVSTRIKFTNKSSRVPITGKRIVSSIQFPISLQEKSPPNRLFSKKSITKDHSPPSSRPIIHSKPSPPLAKKTKSHLASSKPPKKQRKTFVKIPKAQKSQIKVSETKENEEIYQNPFTLTNKLKKIIKSSLKKEKIKKTLEELKKKKEANKREEKKSELNSQNHHIRQMNKRCKKVKLHHKYSWGVDQSRLRDSRDLSIENENSRKARSTEKVRSGLDTIKEINTELGKSFMHFRDHSKISDAVEVPRQRHVSDPEVIKFIRKQNMQKKEKEHYSNMQRFAEASKRQSALNKLFQISRSFKPKRQVMKKKKKLSRVKKSQENVKDSEEIKEQDLHSLTLVYETIMQHEKSEDSKNLEMSKDSSKHTLPEQSKNHSPKPDLKTQSAIKIQRAVRQFLANCRISNQEEFSYTDELVREILSQKRNGETESINSSSLNLPNNFSSHNIDLKNTPDMLEINSSPLISIPKTDSIDIIEKSTLHNKIKEQIILREAQLRTLEQIKEKEMQDLQRITNNVGIDNDLKKKLNEAVENRYNQLLFLLEGNLKGDEESYLNRLGTEEREEFLNELEEKQEELGKIVENDKLVVDSPVESFIGVRDKDAEESRIAIYKPKNADSGFSYDLSEIAHVNDTPQLSNILSPNILDSGVMVQAGDDSQNMFVDDFRISSESSSSPEMPKLEIFSPTLDPPIEEISLELSSSLLPFDSSLSGNFKFEVSENSYTPEYIPDRPSAPLHYFDRESPDTNSPNLTSDNINIENILKLSIEITPELVVSLAENLILQLISEHPVFTKTQKIDTSPESVKLYSQEIYKKYTIAQLTKDLSSPVSIKKLELLQKVQSDIIHYGEIEELLFLGHLINVNVYIDIEKEKDSCRVENKNKDLDILIEAEHIHNKAIFDANNEALNLLRFNNKIVPFGTSKQLSQRKPADKIVEEAIKIVEQWCSNQLRDLHYEEILENISEEEALNQLKEDKLIRMIFADIAESNAKWVDYEFEELQVKLELADHLVFSLSEEVVFLLDS